MKNYKNLTSLTLATGFFIASGTAMAQTVLIDWSTSNDFASLGADTNGNHWNSLGAAGGVGQDVAVTALTTSTNTASGWSVAADLTANTSNNTGTGFGGAGIDGPTGANPFDITGTNRPTVDGLFANYNANGTAVFTFSGLAASTQYDFSLIGGRASNGSNGYIKVITGIAGAGASDIDLLETTGGTGKYADDDFLDTFSLLNDGTIASFSVTSDASGLIAFDFFEGQNDTNGTTNATINALSISQVPEPSAFALLAGMFGLTWVMVRRRA